MWAPTSAVFPDWRGTVTTTVGYRQEPSSFTSPTTAFTCDCHGIAGIPRCAITASTCGPYVASSGFLAVAYRACGQLTCETVEVVKGHLLHRDVERRQPLQQG